MISNGAVDRVYRELFCRQLGVVGPPVVPPAEIVHWSMVARMLGLVHLPLHHVPAYVGAGYFYALACGIPLISAPWDDREGLFEIGRDFLMAHDGEAMKEAMRFLLNDAEAAREIARNGRAIVLARHTCRHRVRELLAICASLGSEAAMPEVA